MSSVQWAITVSPELARAIDGLAASRGDSRSGLIELLLREHALVQAAVADARRAPVDPPRKEPAGHRSRIVVRGEVRL